MQYAALFRGINAGGKNSVKMDDLQQLFLALGLLKVKTYIQSGNVVFETDLEETHLQHGICAGFMECFGFESNVILRSINELRALINKLPISATKIAAAEAADSQVEHLYVYFLDTPPEQSQIDDICKGFVGPDVLRKEDKEVYLLCYQSIRKSKLAIRAAKAFPSATVRNWKTVNKLYDMLSSL
ncbi:MAG: DUF1697 domain-containing protein [Clostridiales bacterium]